MKDSPGVILPVLKISNYYVPKSIMGVVEYSNVPSPPLIKCEQYFNCFIVESSVYFDISTIYFYMNFCVLA